MLFRIMFFNRDIYLRNLGGNVCEYYINVLYDHKLIFLRKALPFYRSKIKICLPNYKLCQPYTNDGFTDGQVVMAYNPQSQGPGFDSHTGLNVSCNCMLDG